MDPRLAETHILVASDVTNPLYGPQGASAVYGPQKGADAAMVAQLDAALTHYAAIIQRDLGRDVARTPGAGAAGGLGAGLLAFTQATLTPGAPLVLETVRFAEIAQGAKLVIVAEGRLDEQTAYGKIVAAVAQAAHRANARTLALVGSIAVDDAALTRLGIDAALPTGGRPTDGSREHGPRAHAPRRRDTARPASHAPGRRYWRGDVAAGAAPIGRMSVKHAPCPAILLAVSAPPCAWAMA